MKLPISPLSRLFLLLSLVFCCCSCQDRTGRICAHFDISLPRGHYEVVEIAEQSYPNGDGEFFVRLSLASAQDYELNDIISQMRRSGAGELPMSSEHAEFISGKCAHYVEHLEKGFYLIDVDETDSRNYSLVVYNEKDKELIVQTIIY